jgi:DNA (cytosine-5)-methyltransferase 1
LNGKAFYNEIEPSAVAVLRRLIELGLIAPGDVCDRSIRQLQPEDLAGYTQVHLFAGGGLWSLAARMAGWPDDRPLWSASCPCQPFSQAGRRAGTADERHLWPDVARLVSALRPDIIVGEQVAGAAGYDWFDGVASDLEREGYTAEAHDIPAAAVDAPHIRQRLYWCAVADALGVGWREGRAEHELRSGRHSAAGDHAPIVGLADAKGSVSGSGLCEIRAEQDGCFTSDDHGGVSMGDSFKSGLEGHSGNGDREGRRSEQDRPTPPADVGCRRNGSFWSDHEWIICHDGKARRTKPGLRLLVNGMAGRVSLWRLVGNSIVPQLAAEFLKAVMETA